MQNTGTVNDTIFELTGILSAVFMENCSPAVYAVSLKASGCMHRRGKTNDRHQQYRAESLHDQ
jgi:hypothetical protein